MNFAQKIVGQGIGGMGTKGASIKRLFYQQKLTLLTTKGVIND